MKTRNFTMAALAGGVALVLSAQVQGQAVVCLPKVIVATTGVNIAIQSTSGNPGDLVTDSAVLNILTKSTLASAIDAAVVTIPLPSDAKLLGFIAPGTVKIEAEIITYTGITGNNLTGATRGAVMTIAAAHASGVAVILQVLGTQNDITVGGTGSVLTVPEASACSLSGKSCGNPTTTCADQTCDAGVCSIDGATCAMASDCAKQTCAVTGTPDCTVNPAILKEATTFGYEPASCCTAGACPGACTGLRALVFSMKSAGTKAPIGDGKTLYTCKFDIAATAANGSYPLNTCGEVASDQSGNPIDAAGSDGAVTVPGQGNFTPTTTPSPTPTTPVGGHTPTLTPTKTVGTPSTPASTATRTRGGGGGGNNDDDSCSIVSPANGHTGWMLLLPAAALLWIRRRSR